MTIPLAGFSRPVRRLLALVLLALPPLLAWPFLVVPWLEARERLAARLDRVLAAEARALALASRGPALAEEVAVLGRALAGLGEGLSGGSHALAGAELQRRLRDAALRHGGGVRSIETLPEGQAGEGTVGVRARLQATPAGLRDLLAELEAGRGLLRVGSLSLGGGALGGASRPLDVQIELHGLRRPGGAP